MKGQTQALFPTFIYRGQLSRAVAQRLNREFTIEIRALSEIDDVGRQWSQKNYPGGYSSYSSHTQLHHTSPHFAELRDHLASHVKKFARALKWDLLGRKLQMTTCWANSMGQGTHHTLHTHPLCVLSGVYYVNLPKGSSPLKLEDPKLPFLMASPPRLSSAPQTMQNYFIVDPKPGEFVLFESWMRHEVPPHRGTQPRLSISFNYEF